MTQTTVSLSTDESATCKHADSPNVAYASMSTFTTTGWGVHAYLKTRFVDGVSYKVYVMCQDAVGNTNADDYHIVFSVSSGGGDVPAPSP